MALMAARLPSPDRFYIDGKWVRPSSDARIDVIDSATEQLALQVAEAQADDVSRAVAAARKAFDEGPWPRMSHAERARYLRRFAEGLTKRNGDLAEFWTRESGVLFSVSQMAGAMASGALHGYAALADTFPLEERGLERIWGGTAMLSHEPVGVVGAN